MAKNKLSICKPSTFQKLKSCRNWYTSRITPFYWFIFIITIIISNISIKVINITNMILLLDQVL